MTYYNSPRIFPFRGGQTQLDRERSDKRGGETAEGSGRAEERMDLMDLMWMDSRTGNDSHLKWVI